MEEVGRERSNWEKRKGKEKETREFGKQNGRIETCMRKRKRMNNMKIREYREMKKGEKENERGSSKGGEKVKKTIIEYETVKCIHKMNYTKEPEKREQKTPWHST